MKISKLPKITKAYLRKNPNLTGIFLVDRGLWLDKTHLSKNVICYLQNGHLNNSSGPALIDPHAKMIYFFTDGVPTRDDGPTMIQSSQKLTFSKGQFKVKQGSIVEEFWCKDGQKHCLSGPAYILRKHRLSEYYIRNIPLTEKEFNSHPEVIEYRKKLALKKKMNGEFGS